jgi:hypothetical protein
MDLATRRLNGCIATGDLFSPAAKAGASDELGSNPGTSRPACSRLKCIRPSFVNRGHSDPGTTIFRLPSSNTASAQTSSISDSALPILQRAWANFSDESFRLFPAADFAAFSRGFDFSFRPTTRRSRIGSPLSVRVPPPVHHCPVATTVQASQYVLPDHLPRHRAGNDRVAGPGVDWEVKRRFKRDESGRWVVNLDR